jgi:hypothetical protein
MKWTIVTIFWTDGKENSDRERNVKFSIEKMNELVNYLTNHGCDVEYLIYDFSHDKIISNSIHLPYPLSVYKRSEKINLVLNKIDSDFFSIIDADCFFDEINYDDILKLYMELDEDSVYNFDWKKIRNKIYIDFENRLLLNKDEWDYAMGNGTVGGLGAFFIVPTKKIKDIGGFDETIETWGGEDGEVLDRLLRITKRVPIKHFSPYHLPHFTDWGNKLYYNR